MTINPGSLNVSAQDLDFSNEATEQLTCTSEQNEGSSILMLVMPVMLSN